MDIGSLTRGARGARGCLVASPRLGTAGLDARHNYQVRTSLQDILTRVLVKLIGYMYIDFSTWETERESETFPLGRIQV